MVASQNVAISYETTASFNGMCAISLVFMDDHVFSLLSINLIDSYQLSMIFKGGTHEILGRVPMGFQGGYP